jgi:putative transposase
MRKPYPSDLTDEPWEIITPLIPSSTVGRPRKVAIHEVLNAIFDPDRCGGPWGMLPHDLPPKSTESD